MSLLKVYTVQLAWLLTPSTFALRHWCCWWKEIEELKERLILNIMTCVPSCVKILQLLTQTHMCNNDTKILAILTFKVGKVN
jgi:hypothetical protein